MGVAARNTEHHTSDQEAETKATMELVWLERIAQSRSRCIRGTV